jgi:hypothetical protein
MESLLLVSVTLIETAEPMDTDREPSFPAGLFHPLQYAGLSRRTLSPKLLPEEALQAGQQFGGVEGLDDVVVGA